MTAADPGAYQRVVSALLKLSKAITPGATLGALLQQISVSATELVGGDRCNIMLLDDSRRYLLSKASHNLSRGEEKITFRLGEGLAGWVAEHALPACVDDVLADRRYKQLVASEGRIVSLVCVPLMNGPDLVGTMTVSSPALRAFRSDHQDLLMFLASTVVKEIENTRLYQLAITDPLTRAFNRQYLYQRLPNEVERSRRYADPLSVVVFDVDHFKKLNDGYGHDAGDFVLQQLVTLTRDTCREVDDLIRYGGEEFVVVMPKTDLEGAAGLAERLRAEVEKHPFVWGDVRLSVTISLGVTSLGLAGESDERLLSRADELLYEAKSTGRNKVAVDGVGTQVLRRVPGSSANSPAYLTRRGN